MEGTADAPTAPEPGTHVARLRGRAGSGPPLLYVPGIDGSGELLLGTAARLERYFDLARLAYRVTGPTPPGGDRYSSLARSVLDVVDELGWRRPLVLAESFGSTLALQLALDAPERVGALALVNGFAYFRRRARLALSRACLPLVPSPLFRAGRHVLAPHLLLRPRRDAAAVRAFREAPLATLNRGYTRRLAMIARADLRPRLGEVRQPVAIFASDRDRVVEALAASETLTNGLPDASQTVLRDAGHVVLPLADEPWEERLVELRARAEAHGAPLG